MQTAKIRSEWVGYDKVIGEGYVTDVYPPAKSIRVIALTGAT